MRAWTSAATHNKTQAPSAMIVRFSVARAMRRRPTVRPFESRMISA
jgi:hypothetical protein